MGNKHHYRMVRKSRTRVMKNTLEDLWSNIVEFFLDIEDKIEDFIDWIQEKLGK